MTTIRLQDELHKRLKQEAEKKDMALNRCLVSVLWTALQETGTTSTA